MENRIYGYIRVSTKEQNEQRQLDAMHAHGIPQQCLVIDKQSGKDFERPGYRRMLRGLRRGDLVVVQSIDRFGRGYQDIMEQWRIITKQKEAHIRVLDMPLLDTTASCGLLGTFISDLVLQLLSFIAENERDTIRQRQAEGIAAAQARGVKFGRPRKLPPPVFDEVVSLWRLGELHIDDAAAQLGVCKSTFYRWVREGSLYLHETGGRQNQWDRPFGQ